MNDTLTTQLEHAEKALMGLYEQEGKLLEVLADVEQEILDTTETRDHLRELIYAQS